MEGFNRSARQALQHLRQILTAGERGYAVAAANVDNRALKMLFRSYAKQRADFNAELQNRTGSTTAGLHSLVDVLAMIHRGRINIFAAMTIGDLNREQMVLKEVLVGEMATLRAYRRALDGHLPDDLEGLLRRQDEAIQGVVHQVELLRGKGGRQLVVRLYDSDTDARQAIKALQGAHFAHAAIGEASAEDGMEAYDDPQHDRLLETVLSGAAGGALWGAVSGALAGIGVVHLPTLGLEHASLAVQEMAWAQTALGAIFSGGFVGAALGLFIGWGIHGGDAYVYNDGQRRGQVLVRLETNQAEAAHAAQIMAQVSREARSQGQHAIA